MTGHQHKGLGELCLCASFEKDVPSGTELLLNSAEEGKEAEGPCGGLTNGSPKDIPVKSLEPVNVTLIGKRIFAYVVKDLEMGRKSETIMVSPKCQPKNAYKRKRRQKREDTEEKVMKR